MPTRRLTADPDEPDRAERDRDDAGPGHAARPTSSTVAAQTAAPASARSRSLTGRALRGRPGDDAVTSAPLALDRLIHERLRLGIVSALAGNATLTFVELKSLLKTTDGNLSVHARKLEDAGYVTCVKNFDGRTPRTEFRLTRAGRVALDRYLDQMEAIISATRRSALPARTT